MSFKISQKGLIFLPFGAMSIPYGGNSQIGRGWRISIDSINVAIEDDGIHCFLFFPLLQLSVQPTGLPKLHIFVFASDKKSQK